MGAIGSNCVRDCVRTSHECAPEDLPPAALADAPVSLLSYGSRFNNGNGEPAHLKGSLPCPTGSTAVPPMPKWFFVFQDGRCPTDGQKLTPRFDEVYQSGQLSSRSVANEMSLVTPRDRACGELSTPRLSPRGVLTQGAEDTLAAEGGEIYEGQYLGGMKHGTGRLTVKGLVYEGEFMDDVKHGNGTLTWNDGRQYCGEFKFGKFDGSAVMIWPDGRHYEGQYSEDRKHGEGIFAWQDGRRYDGQWVCGKRHGTGIYTNAKGLTRRGTWQNDRPVVWDPLHEAPESPQSPPVPDHPSSWRTTGKASASTGTVADASQCSSHACSAPGAATAVAGPEDAKPRAPTALPQGFTTGVLAQAAVPVPSMVAHIEESPRCVMSAL